MAYSPWSVSFGEQPTADKWNMLGTNDASFNDGTGIGTNAVSAASLATNAITLGYAEITSNFVTSSTTVTALTGLSSAVTIPAGGRGIKITMWAAQVTINGAATCEVTIWDGTVGSGTQLALGSTTISAASLGAPIVVMARKVPAAGAKTYNIGIKTSAGTATVAAAATYPAFILVEAI